jgi:hypothetical protein
LTPLVGRERNRPIHIDAIGAAATPLRFLDYLIEETQPGAVLGGSGVLVNVPRPGRFALHKLIVASRRSQGASGATKAPKDRAQASALLRVLLADLPGEITLAWKELSKRGKAWVTAAATSLTRLDGDLIGQLGLGCRRARPDRRRWELLLHRLDQPIPRLPLGDNCLAVVVEIRQRRVDIGQGQVGMSLHDVIRAHAVIFTLPRDLPDLDIGSGHHGPPCSLVDMD